MTHATLRRQLAKVGLSPDAPPDDIAAWQRLLEHISRSYADAEKDRYLLDRSLEISSSEMQELNSMLADRKRALEAVLNNTADGIITATAEGVIVTWNLAAQRIFGYSEAEAIGASVGLLDGEAPPCAPREWLGITRDGAPQAQRRERVGRRREGTLFPLELLVSRVEIGQATMFTGVVRDITWQREAEVKLAESHRRLLDVSRQAGMAEVATSVLHNVGNILNSVNVSMNLVRDGLIKSRLANLGKLTEMLGAHRADLAAFLSSDERGRQLPDYLTKLVEHLLKEKAGLLSEAESMAQGLDHMKTVIAMQQSYAKIGGVVEALSLQDLIEEALRFQELVLKQSRIRVERSYADLPQVSLDKHKLLQILVNLMNNGRHALQEVDIADRCLRVATSRSHEGPAPMIQIEVADNGVGISPENLTRIFAHGFTTKKDGHGFGLHSSALAAKELGGRMTVHSEGLGRGARFVVELPLKPATARSGPRRPGLPSLPGPRGP